MKELYENILIYNYLDENEEEKKRIIADWYVERSKLLPFDEKLSYSNTVIKDIVSFIDSCEFYEDSLKSFLKFILIQDIVIFRYPKLCYLSNIEYMESEYLEELSKFCLIDIDTLKNIRDKDLIENISNNLKKINTLNFYYDKNNLTSLELAYSLLPLICKKTSYRKSKDLEDVLYLIDTYL